MPALLANGLLLGRAAAVVAAAQAGAAPPAAAVVAVGVGELGERVVKFHAVSDVDAFIQACRRAGLGDVHLFTPSAVVDEHARDPVRVCRCLRALAGRAEALGLGLPAFPTRSRASVSAGAGGAAALIKAQLFNGTKPPEEEEEDAASAAAEDAESGKGPGLAYLLAGAAIAGWMVLQAIGGAGGYGRVQGGKYRVRKGDTVRSIARKCIKVPGDRKDRSLATQMLLELNPHIKNPDLILEDTFVRVVK